MGRGLSIGGWWLTQSSSSSLVVVFRSIISSFVFWGCALCVFIYIKLFSCCEWIVLQSLSKRVGFGFGFWVRERREDEVLFGSIWCDCPQSTSYKRQMLSGPIIILKYTILYHITIPSRFITKNKKNKMFSRDIF